MNETITKEVMEQYEAIRQMGPCNMFDYGCVGVVAARMDFFKLASLTRKEYRDLLMNFSELMKKYNIKQEEDAS